ncbi:MerR family transcriptional regulator [Pedobacter sp. ASV28]|uniref:MerR family transcriptional regulator n=1 Tax=Pedobacter sp. ASV28 TaxID=2795123 RepID=UPI0018EAE7C8|nr:MerR family transcriptional regulator [Pedobacter sp. ASV28]
MGIVAKYSIKDLEVLTGIKAPTIRMWEKRYQIIMPPRTETNIRYYGNQELKLLLNINVLNRNGIKISHIAKMGHEELVAKVKDFSFVKSGDDDLFDGLMLSMIDLDESLFHKTFYKAVSRLGFEETINRIIFPFFSRIGIMWQIDSINPAQEHFMSNIVRQKIISAIDNLPIDLPSKAKRVLLFLPEEELHELGMLFLNYVLKNRGYRTVYLGQAVPLNDLKKIVEITDPDILICHVSNPMAIGDVNSFLDKLKMIPLNKRMILVSASIFELNPSLPSHLQLFESLKVLAEQL